ncbi:MULTISPECIES: low molecular weight protein-tyrosine-phosphatase [unclassified Ruminococcus]|uniref:low molecular weight protein-tyrosine-phosphatase n=1 Tax=unclassified Ruminococcus TaxID=2608920 RepID=UPI00210C5F05|nr:MULTISPECIES: low molecular weight protein-tyrosine-phosphatase [unclassified Ruminococcus]MCQ4022294.1 low molecular weight phosphotyrosine protein phosphatase [Ruminococcus sp. zg-924]MCQ4114622.1 low molecular weight phosphotyrosine protein phosphatase [Ruminococcus sp. zg-921]
MTKIMFVCHGNICRSPMAQFVMQDMVDKAGLSNEFYISSAATSTEEIGNPVHTGTRRKLSENGISCEGKRAVQIKASDYQRYDYIIVMDSLNMKNLRRIIKSDDKQKIYKLLDFTQAGGDIADPWYTGNFDITFSDIVRGCRGLLEHIIKDKQ